MNQEKMAVVVDSGCDLPKEFLDRENVFLLPLRIIFKDREYIDQVDITADEIYEKLSEEIPTTSLCTGQEVLSAFDAIKEAGYENVVAITISSNLSGTNNLVNLMAKSYDGLNIHVIDTKNIGMGAGFFAIDALDCLDRGMTFKAICDRLDKQMPFTTNFFTCDTLEYLQKGGRIGLVASILGSTLRLKPVIACNSDGIYYTVKKSRGRKQSLDAILSLAQDFVGDHPHYMLAVQFSDKQAVVHEILARAKEAMPHARYAFLAQTSPALGIYTGPGAVSMAVYVFQD